MGTNEFINKIVCGDWIELLKQLDDESINMVMTSPPYWSLRNYGTSTWEGGDINCKHIKITEEQIKNFENPLIIKNANITLYNCIYPIGD